MGPVRDSAYIRLNPAVFPCKGLNFSVIDSDLSLRAKIPPLDCQRSVLLCTRSRDHRSLHGEFRLSVQVDSATCAAQRCQRVIIIDAGHELGRALPRDFCKLFIRQRRALRLIRSYYCEAACHCRRSH